jgi:hypothetical protein
MYRRVLATVAALAGLGIASLVSAQEKLAEVGFLGRAVFTIESVGPQRTRLTVGDPNQGTATVSVESSGFTVSQDGTGMTIQSRDAVLIRPVGVGDEPVVSDGLNLRISSSGGPFEIRALGR